MYNVERTYGLSVEDVYNIVSETEDWTDERRSSVQYWGPDDEAAKFDYIEDLAQRYDRKADTYTQADLIKIVQLVYEELVDASVLPTPSASKLERHVRSAVQQLKS